MDPLFAKLDGMRSAFDDFCDSNDSRLRELGERMNELEATQNRRGLGGDSAAMKHLLDPESLERKEAFLKYMRLGQDGLGNLQAALSVSSDPEGGYFIPKDTEGKVVEKVHELVPMRQLANIETTKADSKEGILDLEEVEANFVGEKEPRVETGSADAGMWKIPVHELEALPKSTLKLIEDGGPDVENWLIKKLSKRFARLQNQKFLNGTGIKEPTGLLTYPTVSTDDDSRAWGQMQYIPSGAAGGFPKISGSVADDAGSLLDLTLSIKDDYLMNASWLMKRTTLATVAKLKDADGRFLLQTGGGLQNKTPFTLLGFPVYLADQMPAVAANTLSIAFGDFEECYTIVDRLGMTLLRDPYTQKGKILFYTRQRVGGDVLNFEAVKFLKFSAS